MTGPRDARTTPTRTGVSTLVHAHAAQLAALACTCPRPRRFLGPRPHRRCAVCVSVDLRQFSFFRSSCPLERRRDNTDVRPTRCATPRPRLCALFSVPRRPPHTSCFPHAQIIHTNTHALSAVAAHCACYAAAVFLLLPMLPCAPQGACHWQGARARRSASQRERERERERPQATLPLDS